MKKLNLKQICIYALFTAIIAALAQISIPVAAVNLTLQTFGVCLAGFCLGAKGSVLSTVVYLALGAAGLPVFSSFRGGISILLGVSGGFLWGFIFMALFCGLSTKAKRKPIKIIFMISAVLICHIMGIIQYSLVSSVGLFASFVAVSLPFLLKDFIVVFLTDLIAKRIKKSKII